MGNPHPNELKPKASGGTAEAERAAGYYRQILAVPHSTMSCTYRRALPLDRARNRCQKATDILVFMWGMDGTSGFTMKAKLVGQEPKVVRRPGTSGMPLWPAMIRME